MDAAGPESVREGEAYVAVFSLRPRRCILNRRADSDRAFERNDGALNAPHLELRQSKTEECIAAVRIALCPRSLVDTDGLLVIASVPIRGESADDHPVHRRGHLRVPRRFRNDALQGRGEHLFDALLANGFWR